MEAGVNAQVPPVGYPEHDRLIALLNPPEALASMVSEVDPPRATVAEPDDSPSVKSVPAAALGTRIPNKPCVCELPPAVK